MSRLTKEERLLRALGARLREVRRSRGLTQAAVAEACGVDPQTIQRAEQGKVALSLLRLQAVADGLGVPLADLFVSVGHPVPEAPWSADEATVVAEWRRVAAEHRPLALRVLRAFGRE